MQLESAACVQAYIQIKNKCVKTLSIMDRRQLITRALDILLGPGLERRTGASGI